MHRIRVYVDTSVFGGVADEEFAEVSRNFLYLVKKGKYTALISQITFDELQYAPETVKQALADLPAGCVEEVPVSDEAKQLAQAYIEAGALGQGSTEDATHVAITTVEGAGLLLSWNFRHIVNLDRIRKFNSVNIAHGYPQVEIRSPLEVAYGNEGQDL